MTDTALDLPHAAPGNRTAVMAGRLALACALLVAWKVGADVAGALYVADPLKVAARIFADTQSGELIRHVIVTLRLSVIGFAIGCGFGIALPFLLRRAPRLTAAIEPYIMASVGIPKYALVPLFILWFGIGETSKIALVALGVVIPLYLNLVAALRGIDRELYDVARTVKLTRAERVRHILLPGALPGALVGFRQSLGVAWLALVVAEQVNTSSGLGYLINNARDFLQTDVIVVGLLAYAVLGLITDALVRRLERRALAWRDDA